MSKLIFTFFVVFVSFINAEDYLDVINQINLKIKTAKEAKNLTHISKEELELIKSNLNLNKIKEKYYLNSINNLKKESDYYNLFIQKKNIKTNDNNNSDYLLKKEFLDKVINEIKNNIILKKSVTSFTLNDKKYYSFDLNLVENKINELKENELYKENLFSLYNSLESFSFKNLKEKVEEFKKKLNKNLKKSKYIKKTVIDKNNFKIKGFEVNIDLNNNIIIKRK